MYASQWDGIAGIYKPAPVPAILLFIPLKTPARHHDYDSWDVIRIQKVIPVKQRNNVREQVIMIRTESSAEIEWSIQKEHDVEIEYYLWIAQREERIKRTKELKI